MWLLNTKTLELRYFNGPAEALYAILSHVWQDADKLYSFQSIKATYEQYHNSKEGAMAHAPGKVYRFCLLAANEGYEWVWIDTCCIDKTSSAELSEAINSMYAWYKAADLCYVYLYDVPSNDNPFEPHSAFRKSKYHERGWTLQELLAQEYVVFLSSLWTFLGRKDSLVTPLVERTGVDSDILLHNKALDTASVAQRMSWAACRVTTRAEDRAYSLMGIFGVAMPIIYGEGGERAFLRLQKEIIATCPDQSIFAWGSIHPDFDGAYEGVRSAQVCGVATFDMGISALERAECASRNLLARSPSDFQHSASVQRLDPAQFLELSGHAVDHKYTFYSDGVTLHLPVSSHSIHVNDHSRARPQQRIVHAAALACTTTPQAEAFETSITLLFLSGSPNSPDHVEKLSQELDFNGVGLLAQNSEGAILLHATGLATPNTVSCTFYRGATLQLGATHQPSESLEKLHAAPLHSFGSLRGDFPKRELRVRYPATVIATYEGPRLVSGRNSLGLTQTSEYAIEIPNWVFDRLKNRYGFVDSASLLAHQTQYNTFHVPEKGIWFETFYALFVNAGHTQTLGVTIDSRYTNAPCRDDLCCPEHFQPMRTGRLRVFFAPSVLHHHDTSRLKSALAMHEVLPKDSQAECGRAHFNTGNTHFVFPMGSGDGASTRRAVHIWLHHSKVQGTRVTLKGNQNKVWDILSVSIDLMGFEEI